MNENQKLIVDLLAIDNMINAFYNRLIIALTEGNQKFITYYKNEIDIATNTKHTIMQELMVAYERPMLTLVK